jgi:hypothetical protein
VAAYWILFLALVRCHVFEGVPLQGGMQASRHLKNGLSETDSYVPFLACLVSIFLKRKSSNENGRNTLISKELVG